MNYTSFSSLGPGSTPPTIKHLILWTCLLAIMSAGLQALFDQFGWAFGPQHLLSLSWWGLDSGYLWQPLSFLFVQPFQGGLSFAFFLNLLFNMYLLWVIGTSLVEMLSPRSFLLLYFLSGSISGLIALSSMLLTGHYQEIAGATPTLLTLLTVWSMAFAEAQILLFFLIPIKAKWLVAGIVGLLLMIALSHWQLTHLVLYLSAIIIGYGYATIGCGWHSPFNFTQSLDRHLAALGLYLRQHFLRRSRRSKAPTENTKEKVIDLGTGQPLSPDEAFVDAMLAKISKYGESSLTWSEKRRLKQISEKKTQERK